MGGADAISGFFDASNQNYSGHSVIYYRSAMRPAPSKFNEKPKFNVLSETQGQKSDPFLNFSEHRYFVPLKLMQVKMTIFNLSVLISLAMLRFFET